MNTYFNVKLEFDHEKLYQQIEESIASKQKGYVCVVDGNVLTMAQKNLQYREILNSSTVNTCDGSSIALLASLIHHKHFTALTGPELFSELVCKNFKQYFVGNTTENLLSLKLYFDKLGYSADLFKFKELPFKDVEDFEYQIIANEINAFSPDIIWISLGAPKQEWFIAKLFPYINQGLLFAIGAAFNLFLGEKENKRAPKILRKVHLEWFFRVIQEPKRVGKRALSYLIILPRLIFEEIKQAKQY